MQQNNWSLMVVSQNGVIYFHSTSHQNAVDINKVNDISFYSHSEY